MLTYFEIWVESLSIGVRFVLPNVFSSKSNVVPWGGGYRFHLLGDVLGGLLREDRVLSQLFSAAFQLLLAMIIDIRRDSGSYEYSVLYVKPQVLSLLGEKLSCCER